MQLCTDRQTNTVAVIKWFCLNTNNDIQMFDYEKIC